MFCSLCRIKLSDYQAATCGVSLLSFCSSEETSGLPLVPPELTAIQSDTLAQLSLVAGQFYREHQTSDSSQRSERQGPRSKSQKTLLEAGDRSAAQHTPQPSIMLRFLNKVIFILVILFPQIDSTCAVFPPVYLHYSHLLS